jgi:hypothetical protein
VNEDRYQAKLGDYVDGSMSDSEQQSLEAHLETCQSCRAMAADLLEIKSAAGSLERVTPPGDAWKRIADSMRAETGAPQTSPWQNRLAKSAWSHRWALAATAIILIGSAAIMNQLDFFSSEPPEGSVEWVAAELRAADEHYQNAIHALEKIVEKDQSTLDPEVMAVLRENLTVIEDAIGESRTATRQQPENMVAGDSLLTALRRKLSLLQNTVLLINEVRKGQGENALDLIDEMRDSERPDPS